MTRDLRVMAVSLFAWGVGEGMFLIFMTLTLQNWGADPVKIGAILSAMGAAMALVQIPAGMLADRVGSRPIMWASWVLGTLSAAVMALAPSLTVFVAGLLIYGLTSFVTAPMNSYIASVRGKWSVERALTVVSAMFHLGAFAGPLIGGVIGERWGLQIVYQISAVIFLGSTIIVLTARKPPVEEAHEVHAVKPGLASNPRFFGLIALIFLSLFTMILPQPLTPNYLQNQQGFDLQQIGIIGAAGSLGNALIMLAAGHLSATAGFLLGQAFVGLFALFLWRSETPLLLTVGYFFIGGYRLCRSMALAYARSIVKVSEVGLAFGLVEFANAAASIVAPLAAGFLYDRNPQQVYTVSLASISVMAVVNFFLFNSAKAPQPAPTAARHVERMEGN